MAESSPTPERGRAFARIAGQRTAAPTEPIELESRRWLDAIEAETGPLALFDTHTHFGRNDPDGHKQEPAQLLAAMELAGARAVTFPMHEPDGYSAANDEALAAATDSDGRLVAFCRVDPHDGALTEARRCLDAGAAGSSCIPGPSSSRWTSRRSATSPPWPTSGGCRC